MAPTKRPRRPMDERNRNGFDVTCVIGRVEFDRHGSQTPVEAAFALIASHDGNGTFVFPGPNGGSYEVTVTLPNENEPPIDFPA